MRKFSTERKGKKNRGGGVEAISERIWQSFVFLEFCEFLGFILNLGVFGNKIGFGLKLNLEEFFFFFFCPQFERLLDHLKKKNL